jgi:hypothetical protein
MFPNTSLLQEAGTSSPPPAPPVLQPVASIPLRTSVDGSVMAPRLEFGTDGRTLHIVHPVDDGLLDFVLWHAPTIAALLLPLSVLGLLAVVVRTARRRQQFGHYYCQRCNYDVTAPGGMPPDSRVCPECGLDLSTRPARLGRPFTSRVWRWATVFAAMIALCVVTLVLTLERPGAPNAWQRPWLPRLSQTGLMPRLARAYDRVRSARSGSLDVSTWRIPEATPLGRTYISEYAMGSISPDSRWFVWVPYGSENKGVRAQSLADGQTRTIPLPTQGPWNITLIAPGASGGTVLVGYTNSIHRPANLNEAVLAEVDAETGASRIIGAVPLRATDLMAGGRFVHRVIGERVAWAYFIPHYGSGQDKLNGTLTTSDGRQIAVSLPGAWWYGPEMTADGLAVAIGGGGGAGGAGTLKRYSLVDGSETADTLSSNVWPRMPAPGSIRIVSGGGGSAAQPPGLRVESPEGQTLAVLVPWGSWLGGPMLSPDGRWAVAPMGVAGQNWLGEERFHVQVQIWDISSVK